MPQGLDLCQAWAFDLAAKEPAASKKCRVYGLRGLGKVSPTQGAQIRGERRINRKRACTMKWEVGICRDSGGPGEHVSRASPQKGGPNESKTIL